MTLHEYPPSHAARVRALWDLDPTITFLNHGSFGACPLRIREAQDRFRAQMEREPVRFFVRELEPLLDAALRALADFVGAGAADLAFVPNATAGVNTVLRSLDLRPGDELVTTNHEYNACRNALEAAAARAGARVVVAAVPFPLESPDDVVRAVLDCTGPRTRLALVDHVTSQTGLVFPVERLVPELARRGIDTLVDGAHAPGMVPLDLRALGAAYYTGNCHKWMCAPKGAAFLHVRPDKQAQIRPLSISHGANSPRTDLSRFRLEFDWTGTHDPTPYLVLPEAIRFLDSLLPGGAPALAEHNRRTALAARERLCEALGTPPPAPASMIGSLAAVRLPDAGGDPLAPPLFLDPLQEALFSRHGIEVPVIPFPPPRGRVLRISAQIYNDPEEYTRLVDALRAEGVS
ncbi:aminotransferase class V-fold PLP-dependent enzyme [Polyangium sp. y55x31]|uniref:aminotransferase class V-fold PLP-dependent enzyme n=1 Tax=Polyangium sp. y55x31 TaxID=3042688 RepID=UPI002482904B|nr:aminotransferase class V-fold PLP-dependent enzyme [Polyangium sp. y55x31]MDI1478224.1 aminotransferase class V-fold PLP-dependent enzyme [Polyangium sp. y55x31]